MRNVKLKELFFAQEGESGVGEECYVGEGVSSCGAPVFELGFEDVFRGGEPEDLGLGMVRGVLEADKALSGSGGVNDRGLPCLLQHDTDVFIRRLVMRKQRNSHFYTSLNAKKSPM